MAEEASLIPEQIWLGMNTVISIYLAIIFKEQIMLHITIPGVEGFTTKNLKVQLDPKTKISYLKDYISKNSGNSFLDF